MADYPISGKFTVTAVARKMFGDLDYKDTQYGKKKVLKLGLLDSDDTVHETEWYTAVASKEPAVGEQVEGEISRGQYGLDFKKPRGGGSGRGFGGGRSPGETKAIQRQHSQEMGLRREANLIAAGNPPFNDEMLRASINWFEDDIARKDTAVKAAGMTSDVPGDRTDLEPEQPPLDEGAPWPEEEYQ